ncbi:MAG: hypothetical protein AB7K37_14680 [Cyclobacteriaceae bacterium]
MHLLICLVLIGFPRAIPWSGPSRIYHRYLLPGPFFSEGRIQKSDLLYLAIKKGNSWTRLGNPTLDEYQRLFSKGNVSSMYRTRLERHLYERAVDTLISRSEKDRSLEKLKDYLASHYLPNQRDSAELTIIRMTRKDLSSQVDTLLIERW